MWHPHVRFSMRRMIIVVAVLALIFGAFHLKRRSDEFRQRAALISSSPNRAGALRSWVAPRIWPVTLF